jgi:hypothetical protein
MPCKFWRRLVELWQLWQLWLFDLIGTWVVRWCTVADSTGMDQFQEYRGMPSYDGLLVAEWFQLRFRWMKSESDIERPWEAWSELTSCKSSESSEAFWILDQPSGASLQNSLRCELHDEMVAKCGSDASLIQPLWMGRVKQSETVEGNSSSERNDSPNFVKICLYIVSMDFQFLADSSWDSVWDRGHHLARKGDTNGWW